jgi:hypothetical protein
VFSRMNDRIVACLGVGLLCAGAALAQDTKPAPPAAPAPAAPAAAAPAPASGGFEAWNKKTKQPTTWWKWGADLRLRDEYSNNFLTLSSKADRHVQNYFRFRARWWNTVTPVKGLDFNVRMTIESRYWTQQSFSSPFHKGYDWNEIVFDHLNVKWKDVGKLPLSLSVGRQDLMFGDNWLIFEGTPLDGSRTIYFDAARATIEAKKWKTTFDVVLIDQAARNDSWLPPLRVSSDRHDDAVPPQTEAPIIRAQIEQNERGFVLYATNKSFKKAQLDGYVIYKRNRKEPTTDVTDAALKTNLGRGDDADIYTYGGRVVADLAKTVKLRAEAALQSGKKNGVDLGGKGLNSALMFNPTSKMSHQLRLSYEYLSGDNPKTTDKDEQFDILWGRWPRWSELYIYTYAPEARISQLSNLHRVGPGWSCKPVKKAELIADFNWLFADTKVKTSGFFSPEGKSRGQLLTAKLLVKYNAHVTGHVWGELLFPGDFYAAGVAGDPTQLARRDAAKFLRAELLLNW